MTPVQVTAVVQSVELHSLNTVKVVASAVVLLPDHRASSPALQGELEVSWTARRGDAPEVGGEIDVTVGSVVEPDPSFANAVFQQAGVCVQCGHLEVEHGTIYGCGRRGCSCCVNGPS